MDCLSNPTEDTNLQAYRKELGKELSKERFRLQMKLKSTRDNYRLERDSLLSQASPMSDKEAIIRYWYPCNFTPNVGCSPTLQSKQADSYHGPTQWKDEARPMGFNCKVNTLPTPVAKAEKLPENEIEKAPPVREVAAMPIPNGNHSRNFHRVERGKTAVIPAVGGFIKKFIPMKKQLITARNASPQLTAVLRKMIRDEILA